MRIWVEDLKTQTRSLNLLGLELVEVQKKEWHESQVIWQALLCCSLFPLGKKMFQNLSSNWIGNCHLWDHKHERHIKLMMSGFLPLTFSLWPCKKISLST